MINMQTSPGSPQKQTQALQLAERGGDTWKHGDYDKSLALLTTARQLAEASEDKYALATALYHLGELAYVRAFFMGEGDFRQAMDYHQQSLTLREEIDDQPGVALSLSRIGVLYEREQAFDQAMDCFKRALALSEKIDFPQGMIRPYTHIGAYHRRNDDLPTTLSFYQRALAISEEIGDQENIIFGLCNAGWLTYRLEGDREKALAYFYRALEIAKDLGFQFAIGRAHLVLAEFFWSEGNAEQALIYFKKLSQMAHALNYKMLSDLADRRIAEIKD